MGIMSSESEEDRETHGSTIGIGIGIGVGFNTYPSNDSFTSIFTFHSNHSLEIDIDSILSNDSGRFTLFTLGISNYQIQISSNIQFDTSIIAKT